MIASGKWTGPRLPDGQPDVQGFWSNTIANHSNWTDPQGGIPGDTRSPAATEPLRSERRTEQDRAPSRVSDPPDGQVPFQPWARALQQEFLAQFFNPTRARVHRAVRALRAGRVPKSFIGTATRSASTRATCCSCSTPARGSSISTASRTCRRTSSSGMPIRAAIGKATRSSST